MGLPLTEDRERFKLYVGDTGLMVTLAFWDKRFMENELYSKLLSDKLSANLGYVYENLIAQMLRAAGNKLYYHTWPKDESHNYEIDFLLSRGAKICPIEVKSSNHKSHVSLDEFCKKYSSRISNRYLLYTKDLRKDGETLMTPVYMTGLLWNTFLSKCQRSCAQLAALCYALRAMLCAMRNVLCLMYYV